MPMPPSSSVVIGAWDITAYECEAIGDDDYYKIDFDFDDDDDDDDDDFDDDDDGLGALFGNHAATTRSAALAALVLGAALA